MIASGEFDVVLGSRVLGKGALSGGMPLYKYAANRVLTLFENILLDQKLPECHTGCRAWSRRVLETLPVERCSNDFEFDNQILAQAPHWGFASVKYLARPAIFRNLGRSPSSEASSMALASSRRPLHTGCIA
jgi:hypothetical protein